MKIFASLLVLALSVSTAQAMSNMQASVISDLRKSGVPETCLQKVTANDAARIQSWKHGSDEHKGSATRLTRDFVKKICAR